MEKPTFEHVILDTIRESISAHLAERLSKSYKSPLDPFLEAAVSKFAPEIANVYEQAIAEAITNVDIRAALVEAFTHKLARVLISRFEGEIEKRANELRTDPTFRAKLTLAIEAAIVAARG